MCYHRIIMQKMVVRNGDIFEYVVRRTTKSRRVRLIVRPHGSIEVVVPNRVSEKMVEDFVMSKADWILRTVRHYKDHPRVVLHGNQEEDWSVYKESAHARISEKLKYFNQFYGYTWNTITVKKIKSRWGSCSTKRNLNFSYKIALLPDDLADYIIVHELCHLKEMNHGKNFWNLVEQKIPHHRELRQQLKMFV